MIDVPADRERQIESIGPQSRQSRAQFRNRRLVVGARLAHELGVALVAAENAVGQVEELDRGADEVRERLILGPADGHHFCRSGDRVAGGRLARLHVLLLTEAERQPLEGREPIQRARAAEDRQDRDRLAAGAQTRDQATA